MESNRVEQNRMKWIRIVNNKKNRTEINSIEWNRIEQNRRRQSGIEYNRIKKENGIT